MSIKTETFLCLKICSDFLTAEEINNTIGIEFDKFWKKGDFIHKTIIKYKTNCWVLNSKLEKTADFESHLEKLLIQINPHANKVKLLSKKYLIEFSCAIYSNDPNFGVHLTSKVIEKINNMGASFDFDIYQLPE